jgi:hypothetical protein
MKKTYFVGQGGGVGEGWCEKERKFFFFLILGPKRSTRFLKEEYEEKTFVWVSEEF